MLERAFPGDCSWAVDWNFFMTRSVSRLDTRVFGLLEVLEATQLLLLLHCF